MQVGYYPGCALHGSSADFDRSVHACLERLGVSLCELDEWICCGATAAHALNEKLALALPARNLALARAQGMKEMLAPCPLCSMALLKVSRAVAADDKLRREMSEIVELDVDGFTKVVNLVELFQKIGLEKIKQAVSKPLADVKPACYYGCLLVRSPAPPHLSRGGGGRNGTAASKSSSQWSDDSEQPSSMEEILAALGAKPVEWNYKTECCGAGMTMACEDIVLDLAHKIISDAKSHGANCLVVACPMCHVNLDMKQADVERRFGVKHALPVYYLSDLVGRAMGLDDHALGVDIHFVVEERR